MNAPEPVATSAPGYPRRLDLAAIAARAEADAGDGGAVEMIEIEPGHRVAVPAEGRTDAAAA